MWKTIKLAFVVVVVISIGFFVVRTTSLTSHKNCLNETTHATCGDALFERLEYLSDNPSSKAAREAILLVSVTGLNAAGTVSERQLAATQALIDSYMAIVTDSAAECVIDNARQFAVTNIDLQIGEHAVSMLSTASSLEKPLRSLLASQVLPDWESFAFNSVRLEKLHNWLGALPTCAA